MGGGVHRKSVLCTLSTTQIGFLYMEGNAAPEASQIVKFDKCQLLRVKNKS